MSTFNDFVVAELPVRVAMLTMANTGYDGDPNGGGAPVKVSAAPIGTMYLRQTGNLLYQKTSASAGTWVEGGVPDCSGSVAGKVNLSPQTMGQGVKTFANIISPTVYNTNGSGSGDIVLKLGTTVAEASLYSNAKLLSLRTSIGGTEVEKIYVSNTGSLVVLGTSGGTAITATSGGAGVSGTSTTNFGVAGYSTSNYGVRGESATANGVYGVAGSTGVGVYGEASSGGYGVVAKGHPNGGATKRASLRICAQSALPELNISAEGDVAVVNHILYYSPGGGYGQWKQVIDTTGAAFTGAISATSASATAAVTGINSSTGYALYLTGNATTPTIHIAPQSSAPTTPLAGDIYYDSTLSKLRFYNTAWVDCGGGSGGTTMGAFGGTPNANAGTITSGVLYLAPASASFPGGITAAQFTVLSNTSGVNTGNQDLSGYALKSGADFTGEISVPDIKCNPGAAPTPAEGRVYYNAAAHMLRFYNNTAWIDCGGGSGGTTMGAFGGTPNANAGTITSGVLYLAPCNGSYPGGVSTADQTMGAGIKTFANIISPTVYNTNGSGESPTCVMVGTSLADGSVSNTAHILSVCTDIDGSVIEYFKVTKLGATATGYLTAGGNINAAAGVFGGQVSTPVLQCNPGSAPSPIEGQVYYDSGDDKLKYRNASAWVDCGGGSGGTTMGAFGTSPNANAGTITSGVLYLQPANGTYPGGVSIYAQTFAGNKTFSVTSGVAIIASGGTYGTYGSGTNYGVFGTTAGTDGPVGVGGSATGASGINYGGYFTATSGIGVYGRGTTYGVQGAVTGSGTAVQGDTTGGGYGGTFTSSTGTGCYASGATGGVLARASGVNIPSVEGWPTVATGVGVKGSSPSYRGVYGTTSTGYGVYGESTSVGDGVHGISGGGTGVHGEGVQYGVHGSCTTASGCGTSGICDATNGTGVYGQASSGYGVEGYATTGIGVLGYTVSGGIGVKATSNYGNGSNGALVAIQTGTNGNAIRAMCNGSTPNTEVIYVGQQGTGRGMIIDMTGSSTPRACIRFTPQASASNALEGDVYYDSTDHKLKVWSGSAWDNLN